MVWRVAAKTGQWACRHRSGAAHAGPERPLRPCASASRSTMTIATHPCARSGFVARGPRFSARFDSALRKSNVAGWSGGLRADVLSIRQAARATFLPVFPKHRRESCEPPAGLRSAWTSTAHADRLVTTVSGQCTAIHARRCCLRTRAALSGPQALPSAFAADAPPARRFVAAAVVGWPSMILRGWRRAHYVSSIETIRAQ